ncbi:flippase-like domain-containing protein [Candidatus Woesearchaeota archaeon]|nr:flippase-like domain-containing protein [Candidatus Woesearchaeota archaeon]
MDTKKLLTQAIITKAIVGSVLGGLALSIILVWGVGAEEILATFLHAKWYLILAYLTTSIAIAIAVTKKWAVALDAYGVRLPFGTLFIYRLIGFAVGYVTPTAHVGGEPVRAMLVGQDGIPYKISFSAVIVDKLIELMFNLSVFFLGALIIANSSSFPIVARVSIFIISLILIIAATLFTYQVFKKKKIFVPLLKFLRFNKRKNWAKIKKTANDMELLIEFFYAKRKKHFHKSILLNAILWCLMFAEYKVALLILGYDASLFGIFLFLTGVGIAYSIPIPAALGVLELGQISAGALLGLNAAIGVALAFLIRIRDLAWTIIGLVMLGFYHLNIFNLYDKSRAAAKKYNFDKLHPEMRSVMEGMRK